MIKSETMFHVVNSPLNVTEDRVRDLIVSAFEGGSNYWIESITTKIGDGLVYEDFKEGGRFAVDGEYFPGHILVPFHPKCSLEIKNQDEEKSFTLNVDSMKRGLDLMAKNHANHWSNFVTEDDDADTADVFLQLCLFGEIVYG